MLQRLSKWNERQLSLSRENNKNILSLLERKLERQQSIWHKNELSLLHRKLQRQQSILHKNKLSLLERKLERQQSIWQRKRQSNCLQTSSCPKLSISCRAKIPMSYFQPKRQFTITLTICPQCFQRSLFFFLLSFFILSFSLSLLSSLLLYLVPPLLLIIFIATDSLASLWILHHTTNRQTKTWRPKIPDDGLFHSKSMMWRVSPCCIL